MMGMMRQLGVVPDAPRHRGNVSRSAEVYARWPAMAGDLDRWALSAAAAVAGANGLAHDEAVVMHSGSNVLVHLRPVPVVARVMTGTVTRRAVTHRCR